MLPIKVAKVIAVLAVVWIADDAFAKCRTGLCIDARMQVATCEYDPKKDAAFKDTLKQFKDLPPGAGIDRMLAKYLIELTGKILSASTCAASSTSSSSDAKIDVGSFIGQSYTFVYGASAKDFCNTVSGVTSVRIAGGCCEGQSPGFGQCSEFTLMEVNCVDAKK